MKFASAKQIIAMIVISAALLYALDYWKNPQLWHEEVAASTANHAHGGQADLTLWINGACLLGDVRQALSGLEGIDLADASAAPPSGESSLAGSRTSVSIPVTEIAKLDFAALDRALRQNGLVAGRMDLSGVKHFGLQAEFSHLPSKLTDNAVEERISYMKAQGLGEQFEWVDSVDMNSERKALTAYARYMEPGKSVNVAELVAGLNQIGLSPNSLRVVIGEERGHGKAK
jgi:hypothetical protein